MVGSVAQVEVKYGNTFLYNYTVNNNSDCSADNIYKSYSRALRK